MSLSLRAGARLICLAFALAEWGFLAPRADGRYRVLHAADDDPAV